MARYRDYLNIVTEFPCFFHYLLFSNGDLISTDQSRIDELLLFLHHPVHQLPKPFRGLDQREEGGRMLPIPIDEGEGGGE